MNKSLENDADNNFKENKLASDFKNIPHMIALFQSPIDAKKDYIMQDVNEYLNYLDRCLNERQYLGVGKSGAFNALFRFWCYYLRKHFNQEMYNTFRKIAMEDAKNGARYGLECLFRYYSYGLEYKFRPEIFDDFQTDTLADYETGQLYGLEKFWAFLAYCKNANGVPLKPELEYHLSKFNSLDDFRQEEKLRGQHYSGRRRHLKKTYSNGITNEENFNIKNNLNPPGTRRSMCNINQKRSYGDFFPIFKTQTEIHSTTDINN